MVLFGGAEEPLLHGGDLDAARRLFPGVPEPFLDLSTGINPNPYPLPRLPADLFARLPAADAAHALAAIAARAYGLPSAAHVVAGPGTQILLPLVAALASAGVRVDCEFARGDIAPTNESVLALALREAVTNVARHARARSARVEVTLQGVDVVLTVTDDGVGLGDTDRRSGLANLAARAAELGGSAEVGPGPDGRGTRLVWRAPVR